MSYKNKITNYQGDCEIILGNKNMFSEYIKDFALTQTGNGLDVGAGPGGCNGKYFSHCISLDGCDADDLVVESLPSDIYTNKLQYNIGSLDKLPFDEETKDFVVCSCVIQHLNSFQELDIAIKEMSRILKVGGKLYLMFKSGNNDTKLTHFNNYYKEERSFRVFDPKFIIDKLDQWNLHNDENEIFMDDNWIPYCRLILTKI